MLTVYLDNATEVTHVADVFHGTVSVTVTYKTSDKITSKWHASLNIHQLRTIETLRQEFAAKIRAADAEFVTVVSRSSIAGSQKQNTDRKWNPFPREVWFARLSDDRSNGPPSSQQLPWCRDPAQTNGVNSSFFPRRIDGHWVSQTWSKSFCSFTRNLHQCQMFNILVIRNFFVPKDNLFSMSSPTDVQTILETPPCHLGFWWDTLGCDSRGTPSENATPGHNRNTIHQNLLQTWKCRPLLWCHPLKDCLLCKRSAATYPETPAAFSRRLWYRRRHRRCQFCLFLCIHPSTVLQTPSADPWLPGTNWVHQLCCLDSISLVSREKKKKKNCGVAYLSCKTV